MMKLLRQLLFLGLALQASACVGRTRMITIPTQRWPEPMPLAGGAADESADWFAEGPEEVLVVRHADPVQLKPAGTRSAFPMGYRDKQRRVNAGSWIYCMPGGRAEILWPGGNTVVLFGKNTGVVGSPSRGQENFIFLELERAELRPAPEDRIALLGGARLSGEEGPIIVEQVRDGIQRVKNQSKRPLRIEYLDERFELDPGERIDLPLLSGGSAPKQTESGGRILRGDGYEVVLHGSVDQVEDVGGVRLQPSAEHNIAGLGIRVRLLEGEEVLFQSLGQHGETATTPAQENTAQETQASEQQ